MSSESSASENPLRYLKKLKPARLSFEGISQEEKMVFEKCEFCGLKFDRMKTVKYKHKSYCSFKCKEDAIDAESHVNGLYLPGTCDDNPARDLFDWAFQGSRLY